MAALAGVLLAAPGSAQTFPKLAGHPVVDQAGIIPAPEEAALNAQLLDLQKQTGHQHVVATIGSLEGPDIGDYGYQLGRSWGIGGKGEDGCVVFQNAPHAAPENTPVAYGPDTILDPTLAVLRS